MIAAPIKACPITTMAIICSMNNGCAIATIVLFFAAVAAIIVAFLMRKHAYRHHMAGLALLLTFAVIVVGFSCAWATSPGCSCTGKANTAAAESEATVAAVQDDGDDDTVVDEEDVDAPVVEEEEAAPTVVTAITDPFDGAGDDN